MLLEQNRAHKMHTIVTDNKVFSCAHMAQWSPPNFINLVSIHGVNIVHAATVSAADSSAPFLAEFGQRKRQAVTDLM